MGVLTHLDNFTDAARLRKTKKALNDAKAKADKVVADAKKAADDKKKAAADAKAKAEAEAQRKAAAAKKEADKLARKASREGKSFVENLKSIFSS